MEINCFFADDGAKKTGCTEAANPSSVSTQLLQLTTLSAWRLAGGSLLGGRRLRVTFDSVFSVENGSK